MERDSDLGSRLRAGLLLMAGAALLLYALWPWLPLPGRPARPRTVVFYGFSILGEAMNRELDAILGVDQRRRKVGVSARRS